MICLSQTYMHKSQNPTKEELTQHYCIHLPKYIQNEWKQLFTKQLYCIGKDISYDNNLLLQYGFTRQRPPNPDLGSSQYSLGDRTGRIILWGFGMICATKNDGLFLWRHAFEPKLLKINSLLPHIWDPDQLPECTIPKNAEEILLMLKLLVKSIKWLKRYEIWILSTYGQSYRNERLHSMYSFDKPNIRLDKSWSDLSSKFEKILKEANISCR